MNKTKKITAMGMFAALSYVVMLVCKILPPMFPAVPFLSYDAKDVIIVIGGFIYGPLSAFLVSCAVSLIEMATVSETHLIGCVMNIVSTCAFACTASAIYAKMHNMKGAIVGLAAGTVCAVATMLVWNYFLTPIYTGMPRQAIESILIPFILPFNAVKSVLNAAFVLIFYKPFVTILRRAGIVEKDNLNSKTKINLGMLIAGVVLVLMCTFAIFIING